MRGYEPHVILFHYPAVKLAEKEGFEPSEDFVLGSLAKICLKRTGLLPLCGRTLSRRISIFVIFGIWDAMAVNRSAIFIHRLAILVIIFIFSVFSAVI